MGKSSDGLDIQVVESMQKTQCQTVEKNTEDQPPSIIKHIHKIGVLLEQLLLVPKFCPIRV